MKRTLLILSLIALGLTSATVLRLSNHHKTVQLTPQEIEAEAIGNDISSALSDDRQAASTQEELQVQRALIQKAIEDVTQGITTDSFNTGSPRFDGEWVSGSYQMAVLGLGQFILAHPDSRDEYLPMMEQSVERLIASDTNAFGTAAWGEEGLSALASDNDHAYLGYVNLALSMLRLHQEDNQFAALNDQLTATFIRRLKASPQSILETYPNEAYPADIAAVIASIGLYDQATGKRHSDFLSELTLRFRQNFVDPDTGLVFQAVDPDLGHPVDKPRSSGTALSAYFMSFVDINLAETLFYSVVTKQQAQIYGFTGIKEYPEGQTGEGDIDSGTLAWGISPSATAFTIGGARLFGEQALYRELYQTIQFFSTSPLGEMNGISLLDSPLGNAILLAMFTALEIED